MKSTTIAAMSFLVLLITCTGPTGPEGEKGEKGEEGPQGLPGTTEVIHVKDSSAADPLACIAGIYRVINSDDSAKLFIGVNQSFYFYSLDSDGYCTLRMGGSFDYAYDTLETKRASRYMLNLSLDTTGYTLCTMYTFSYYDSIPEKHVMAKDYTTFSLYYQAGNNPFSRDSLFLKKE